MIPKRNYQFPNWYGTLNSEEINLYVSDQNQKSKCCVIIRKHGMLGLTAQTREQDGTDRGATLEPGLDSSLATCSPLNRQESNSLNSVQQTFIELRHVQRYKP